MPIVKGWSALANLKFDSQSGLSRVAILTDPDQIERVILYQICAGTLCGLYTAFAKASVGLFLLRIVFERWQRIAIWASITLFFIWAVIGKSAISCDGARASLFVLLFDSG